MSPLPLYLPYSLRGRSYKFIQLENGIVCLLISEPTQEEAAVCLSVATGHHADPDSVPGLAHLCEHMVCVSSKEYPKVDLYKTMVHNAGGTWNAVTVDESTSFFFTVPIVEGEDSSLDKITDVFASYFKHPLFDSSYAEREIIAVDNENSKNCSLGGRLAFYGIKLLANPAHPFHRFATGNSTTLHSGTDSATQTLLKDFFAKEYLPERMVVTIKGPQTINILQRIAVGSFGDIGVSHKSRKSLGGFTTPSLDSFHLSQSTWTPRYSSLKPFSHLGRYILIDKPDSGETLLRLVFPFSQEHSKFASFWCHILGSETSGSLNSWYMSEHLVSELVAKVTSVSTPFSALELQLTLTRSGARNLTKVIQSFFDYTSMFAHSTDSKFERKLAKAASQYNGIEMYNFYHEEGTTNTLRDVRTLNERLMKGVSKWLFLGVPCFDSSERGYCGEFKESKEAQKFWISQAHEFRKFVSSTCHPSNMLVSYLGDSKLPEWAASETLEDFNMKIKYQLGKLDDFVVDSPKDWFHIPPPNQFCPDLVSQQTQLIGLFEKNVQSSLNASLGYAVKNITTTSVPKLVVSDGGQQLWIKKEVDPGYLDKLFVSMEITSTAFDKTQLSQVISLEILISLVRNRLRELLYPALVMGYDYDFEHSMKGDCALVIQVSGPEECLVEVLETILGEIRTVANNFVATNEYREARVEVKKKYTDIGTMPSWKLAVLGLMAIMEENTWLVDQRLDALEELSLDQAKRECHVMFSRCYVSSFVHGDLKAGVESEVQKVVQNAVGELRGGTKSIPSTVRLTPGANFTVKSQCKDPMHSLGYFLQTSLRNDEKSHALTKFTSYVMSHSLLNKLRVQYQLGYVVIVGLRVFRQVEGIHVTIMSGNLDPEALEDRVEQIIMEWYKELSGMNSSSFKATYLDKFLAAYSSGSQKLGGGGPASLSQGSSQSSLSSQHQGYWDQIVTRSYRFSNNSSGESQVDTRFLQQLSFKGFLRFVQEKILPTSSKRIKVASMLFTDKAANPGSQLPMQIYCFLSSVGLPIPQGTLGAILVQSKGSKIAVCKNLLKYYRTQGKGIKLIAAGIGAMSSTFFGKSLHEDFERQNCEEIKIEDLALWQTQTGYTRSNTLNK